MNLEETRKRILVDDDFVLSEANKFKAAYKLKKVIRAGQKRTNTSEAESVAEHVYGMHLLANYFLPLEDICDELDKLKILEIITWHDLDEAEIGDVMAHVKTDADRQKAELELVKLINGLPDTLKDHVNTLMDDYENKRSLESKFVRAIDKIEPLFEVYCGTESYRDIMHEIGFTLDKHLEIKRPHVANYPYINRFVEVTTNFLAERNYFPTT